MTFEELDMALEELETRLERLRALYEQYFLGFEKIEPTVPRKDVDRRIYVLRREKIRNTGRRFKLQTLIQRYNTFQQYWQRVCREIENGTYRRHLARVERQLNPNKQLTIATRRRFGKALELAQRAAAEADGQARPSSAPPAAADPRTTSLPPPSGPTPLRPPARPAAASPLPSAPPASAPPASQRPQRPSAFDSLELDMGFLGSWVPPTPGAPAPPAARRAGPPPKPVREVSPEKAPPARPISSPKAAPPPKPKSSPKAAPPPKPAAQPKAAPPPKPARPGTPPKPPSAERSPAAPPPKPQSQTAAAAPAAKPKSSPKAAPGPQATPRAAAPAEASRTLADDRVKELHQKLMELKKQNKETGHVSLEGLAKTLRDTESKLRSQHKNRKIDFDVVIRDGKAIVKPTVR